MPERSGMDWDARFLSDDTPWEREALHPAAEDWLKSGALEPGMRVIIPGCGRAPEVLTFAKAGLTVMAGDLSPTAIAWQRAQLEAAGLKAELFTGDLFSWAPETPADAIYEQTFLCAISPKRRTAYEQVVHAWLKPGGHLLALFMQKEERGGPPYGCALDAMHDLFPDDRWAWPEDSTFIAHPHPALNNKPELAGILVRR